MGWHPEKQMHAVLASLKKAALKVRAQEQVSGRSETTEISRKKMWGSKGERQRKANTCHLLCEGSEILGGDGHVRVVELQDIVVTDIEGCSCQLFIPGAGHDSL